MKTFGGFLKTTYLCTRFRGRNTMLNNSLLLERALSSAGSEHLPYKQRVGGSNPSAPTIKNTNVKGGFNIRRARKVS